MKDLKQQIKGLKFRIKYGDNNSILPERLSLMEQLLNTYDKGEAMKDWQVDLIRERDTLEIKIKSIFASSYDNVCDHAERLYHMTKYLQSLDKKILSWEISLQL